MFCLQSLRWKNTRKPRHSLFLLLCLCTLFLSACKAEVYGGLNEEQANLMLSALLKRGVTVSKENKGKNGFTIAVEQAQLVQALEILRENGLPHDKFQSLGDVFKGQGMISSPLEGEARLAFALSQELSNTFARIDGVLSARVHVVLGKVDEAVNLRVNPSVSVFIRYNSDSSVVTMVAKIRELSANAVPGLTADKVSVMLVPVRETVTVPPVAAVAWYEGYVLPGLLAAALMGAGVALGVAYFVRTRKRKDVETPV